MLAVRVRQLGFRKTQGINSTVGEKFHFNLDRLSKVAEKPASRPFSDINAALALALSAMMECCCVSGSPVPEF